MDYFVDRRNTCCHIRGSKYFTVYWEHLNRSAVSFRYSLLSIMYSKHLSSDYILIMSFTGIYILDDIWNFACNSIFSYSIRYCKLYYKFSYSIKKSSFSYSFYSYSFSFSFSFSHSIKKIFSLKLYFKVCFLLENVFWFV